MSREFGLYPKNREPQLWIGCRAIIMNGFFDVPWDRWSEDIKYESGKDDFVWWINNIAVPKLKIGIKGGKKKFHFASENYHFICEADDKDSDGYLYVGFYSSEEYDDIAKQGINMRIEKSGIETELSKIIEEAIKYCQELIEKYDSNEDVNDIDISHLIEILKGRK